MINKNFIQIEGENFILKGEKFIPKGVNLGNWLNIEHFMHGLPSVESDMHIQMNDIFGKEKTKKYWKAYRDNYIREKDFEYMASMGFNCVRLPINANMFYETKIFGEQSFIYLDKTFEWGRKHNIYVQLDLHALPGGQARDHNADPIYGINTAFWNHEFFRKQALEVSEALAKRYSNEEYLWAYSPACEPMTDKIHLLQEYYRNTIDRIRLHDKEHVISLEPNHWARDISSLPNDLFTDPQVTYQIHIYFFFHFDYNAMDDYPCDNGKIRMGRSELEEMIALSVDKKRIKRPVTLAEFGVVYSMNHFMNGVKDAKKMRRTLSKGTRDMRLIMEENEGGWCLWSFKDIGEIGLIYPKDDIPWKNFLNQEKIKNLIHWTEFYFEPNFKEIQNDLSPFQKLISEQFKTIDYDTIAATTLATKRNIETLALRSILIEMNKLSEEELLELASSFKLENCQQWPEVNDIILRD